MFYLFFFLFPCFVLTTPSAIAEETGEVDRHLAENTNFSEKMNQTKNTNPLSNTQETFHEGILTFSLDLKNHLSSKNKNGIYSPFSIATTLGITAMGAKNKTLEELKKGLHYKGTQEELGKAFKTLISNLVQRVNGYPNLSIFLDNVLWMQKEFQFLPVFQSVVVNDFFGDLRLIDFSKNAEAVQEMNHWFLQKSLGKLGAIFTPSDITPATRLIAISTLFFKGAFDKPFEPSHTREKPFHISKEVEITIDTMYQKNTFLYYQNQEFSVVELSYLPLEKEFSLWIILPKSIELFDTVVGHFQTDTFHTIYDQLQPQYLELELPRLKIESSYDLIPTLQEMGIKEPFSQTANFSLMTDDKNLMISGFKHRALWILEESGTLAEAASAAIFSLKALPPQESPLPFKADHPFLFMIVDKKGKTPIFIGQVIEPKKLTQ